jgi:hypothetical protein
MGIKIVGIDVDHVSKPVNDGTRGSGLYRVPLNLSERPSTLWAEIFPHVWNQPPRYTSMHRPGIAHVSGSQIVLDGTTVEEVRDYHLETLKGVIPEVERKVAEVEAQQRREREKRQAQERAHDENVRNIAKDIKFED